MLRLQLHHQVPYQDCTGFTALALSCCFLELTNSHLPILISIYFYLFLTALSFHWSFDECFLLKCFRFHYIGFTVAQCFLFSCTIANYYFAVSNKVIFLLWIRAIVCVFTSKDGLFLRAYYHSLRKKFANTFFSWEEHTRWQLFAQNAMDGASLRLTRYRQTLLWWNTWARSQFFDHRGSFGLANVVGFLYRDMYMRCSVCIGKQFWVILAAKKRTNTVFKGKFELLGTFIRSGGYCWLLLLHISLMQNVWHVICNRSASLEYGYTHWLLLSCTVIPTQLPISSAVHHPSALWHVYSCCVWTIFVTIRVALIITCFKLAVQYRLCNVTEGWVYSEFL